jgi:hypothetical protein
MYGNQTLVLETAKEAKMVERNQHRYSRDDKYYHVPELGRGMHKLLLPILPQLCDFADACKFFPETMFRRRITLLLSVLLLFVKMLFFLICNTKHEIY